MPDLSPEALFDHRFDFIEGNRIDVIPQSLHLGDQILRENIGATGNQLTQFDVNRSQFLKCKTQSAGKGDVGIFKTEESGTETRPQPCRQILESMACQHPGDIPEPGQVSQGLQRFDHNPTLLKTSLADLLFKVFDTPAQLIHFLAARRGHG